MTNDKNYIDKKQEELEMATMRKQMELMQKQIDLQNEVIEKNKSLEECNQKLEREKTKLEQEKEKVNSMMEIMRKRAKPELEKKEYNKKPKEEPVVKKPQLMIPLVDDSEEFKENIRGLGKDFEILNNISNSRQNKCC